MFNILIVEDDKNLRKLITTCLKREKYKENLERLNIVFLF